MTFVPAPGVHIDDGLQLINNLLTYDDSKPIDSLNAPKLFVSERCENFIYAMQEYTAKGSKTRPPKTRLTACATWWWQNATTLMRRKPPLRRSDLLLLVLAIS
jgi:hypothetical protein